MWGCRLQHLGHDDQRLWLCSFRLVLCKWTNILSDASNTAVSSGAGLEVYVN